MAFDYSSRDYETIKREMVARASRVFPEWTDRDPSDFGMMMLDLWAYSADVLHYYIDRAAGESFLATATQRESVLALANLLDYVPRGRSSATSTLSLQNNTGAAITVPPYTEFLARYDETTYQVFTETGGTILAAATAPIIITEGTLYRDEVLTSGSSGVGGQRYTLSASGAALPTLVVTVYEDGVTPTVYQRVSRLSAADTGDRSYSTEQTADGFVDVVFGTSLNGFIPPPGALITATYATSSGSSGNLPANAVVGFKTGTPSGLSIVSSAAFSGGLDEESIASLKRSIPSVISSQNRAVTRNDFIALATQVEGVAKATIAFTPNAGGSSAGNASVTVYAQAARSDYLTTVDTSQTVSAVMQADVVSSIQPRALLGVTVTAAPTITWAPIDIEATVFVNERYVSNWVRRNVEAAIEELFEFDNVFFGQRLTLGQVYRLVLNVPGVDYATITLFDTSGGTAVDNNILINELQLPKMGSVVLTMSGGITTS